MQVDPVAAQRFSEVLIQIYSADTESAIMSILAAGEKMLDGAPELLVTLMRDHARHHLGQLRKGGETWEIMPMLTQRENEILRHVASGETDSNIGRALGISPKTVSKHVENILFKLGVESRTAAASLAPHAKPTKVSNLSLREQEVLYWIGQGKRDSEIAQILSLSGKTVSKHVEHVLAKLKVANRTAAMNAARMV